MNPAIKHISPRRRRERAWFWLPVAAIVLLPVLVAVGVASYFYPSSDIRALCNGLTRCSKAEWDRVIVLNIGGLTTSAVRTGLSFAKLDEDAHAALRAVRAVEVGIYRLKSGSDVPDRTAMLTAADEAMAARGWDRIVSVTEHGDLVAVYTPSSTTSFSKVKCCVMVFHGEELIVASARANLEPLVKFVLAKHADPQGSPFVATGPRFHSASLHSPH